jgi:hypothetical protein
VLKVAKQLHQRGRHQTVDRENVHDELPDLRDVLLLVDEVPILEGVIPILAHLLQPLSDQIVLVHNGDLDVHFIRLGDAEHDDLLPEVLPGVLSQIVYAVHLLFLGEFLPRTETPVRCYKRLMKTDALLEVIGLPEKAG